MTVNENGYINNSNVDSSHNSNYKVTVHFGIANPLEKDSTSGDYYIEVLDTNGNKVSTDTAGGLSITSQKADIVLHKDLVKDTVDIYLASTTSEGKYTIVLKDRNGNIVSRVETELSKKTPKAILVNAGRPSSAKGTLSLTAVDSGATKAYYIVCETADTTTYSSKAVSAIVNLATGKTADTDAKIVSKGSATLTNNKLEDLVVSSELSSDKSYAVVFVLESKQGNVSTTVEKADILVDDDLTAEPNVVATTIVEPDLKTIGATAAKTFTWTAPVGMTASAHYGVVIYKDGEIIDEVDCSGASFASTNSSLLDLSKPGKYKISIRVKGNGTTTKDSEPVESDEIEVTALRSVTDITLESTTKVKWEDPNTTGVAGYTVTLTQLTGAGKGTTVSSSSGITVSGKEGTITSPINANEIYEVSVTATAANTQSAIVGSEATVKKCFVIGVNDFKVDTTKTTDHSVTLNANKIVVDGTEASYEVRAYNINTVNVPENGTYKEITSGINTSIEKDDNGNLVILVNGLEAEKKYAFRLIATVDGIEGTSGYITEETFKAAPAIVNKNVVKSSNLAVSGTIYVYTTSSDSKKMIVVDGTEYNITDNEYSQEFESLYEVVEALNSNDVITAQENSLSLKLGNTARADLDLGKTVKGKNVEIEGAGYETAVTITANYGPAEIVLKGTGAQFNVDNLRANKIKLENGVVIFNTTSGRNFEVLGNATINGIDITTQKALDIYAKAKEVNIHVNSNTNNNDLTIVNNYAANVATGPATIKFVGESDNSSKYVGTVKITSVGGGITVSQSKVNVTEINLDIDVTDADVTLTDVAFTGNKDINVTITADGSNKEVAVLAKSKATVELTNFELKTYKDANGVEDLETLRTALTSASVSTASSMTEKQLREIQTFLNSFGINDIGAQISTKADSNEVTITFTKAVGSVEIKGIN